MRQRHITTSSARRAGGGIEPDEMHIYLTVVLERGRGGKAGGERAAEGVNEDIDLLSIVFGEFAVDGGAVEVIPSDVAFE